MNHGYNHEFERNYYDNYKKVYNLALGLTGNINDAEEITQEAFLRAFRSFDTFRKDSSFFTWIYRITLNVANSYMKQRMKMPVYALTEDIGYTLEDIMDEKPSYDPETLFLAKEAKFQCLHCLTECLPNEQRKIFCLAITIDLPYKLVAEIMECSLSKVKTTIHRAKQRWFGYMENRCQFIKKSNPCHCTQWVRFGLEQGWITKDKLEAQATELDLQALEEIRELRSLRDFYKELYAQDVDEALIKRIREGIRKKEWTIIL
ncbi:MAG: RNA polymerase subunit sigma-24 [Clostridia bacterium BRH_c25]|nr:MAG: RNA polymerase subunit sigma-24 [Clostridia bacterium BRH_c25]